VIHFIKIWLEIYCISQLQCNVCRKLLFRFMNSLIVFENISLISVSFFTMIASLLIHKDLSIRSKNNV
jgi:hypothetical protein